MARTSVRASIVIAAEFPSNMLEILENSDQVFLCVGERERELVHGTYGAL